MTIAVDLPKGIFSFLRINIATAAPPTTPGESAEANSQSIMTKKDDFQVNLFEVNTLIRHI